MSTDVSRLPLIFTLGNSIQSQNFFFSRLSPRPRILDDRGCNVAAVGIRSTDLGMMCLSSPASSTYASAGESHRTSGGAFLQGQGYLAHVDTTLQCEPSLAYLD